VKEQLKVALGFAKQHDLYVSVGGEDASRADLDFLAELMSIAHRLGADRFRFCDTLGILDPFTTFDKVQTLREKVPALDLEVHTHNDLGMATANAIAGLRAGARFVNTTVNGLGERAGNAALEEVVMALKHACGIDTGIDSRRFVELSKLVGQASCRPVPEWKAVVGERAFAVESGLHADGVLKYPGNYEGFDPAEVGLDRQIVLGKHSGSHGLRHRLAALDIVLAPEEVSPFMVRVRSRSQQLKRPLDDGDLLALLAEGCRAA
jgi:homocitrate synthase NifV